MSRGEALRQAVAMGLNFARARRFPAPVLVSVDAGMTLVGFSVMTSGGVDICVEANHVDPSRLEDSSPLVLTTRSLIETEQADVEWEFHALDYLLGARSFDVSSRDELLEAIAAARRESMTLDVDGRPVAALSFRVGADLFAQFRSAEGSFISIAGPDRSLVSGFTTTIE